MYGIGPDVTEFKIGERVAAFHRSGSPGGGYAEFAVAPADTTMHIPTDITFEGAATVPLAALTAAVLLFRGLGIPEPWGGSSSPTNPEPLVVYGGASAVGAFAIQLARRSGLHPIIAVAGRGISFVKTLLDLDNGDAVVDYRAGDESVVTNVLNALNGVHVRYAFDAMRTGSSYINLAKILESSSSSSEPSKLALVLPLSEQGPSAASKEADLVPPFRLPPNVLPVFLGVNLVHNAENERDRDFGFVFSRYLARGFAEGWLRPHPHEVQPGGLDGLQSALRKLRNGDASAVKYVLRFAETSLLGHTST